MFEKRLKLTECLGGDEDILTVVSVGEGVLIQVESCELYEDDRYAEILLKGDSVTRLRDHLTQLIENKPERKHKNDRKQGTMAPCMPTITPS